MKKSLIIAGFFLNLMFAIGQEWTWSNQLVCDSLVIPTEVITDDNNNVYLAGYYIDHSLTVGPYTIPNSGSWDGFICKFNSDGDVLWLEQIASSSKDEIVSLIILGTDLYVTGNFKDDVYFTPTDFIINSNNYDSFLARYDLDGNFQEASHLFWGTHVERVKNVIYNPNTNEFVINVQFQNQIIFNNTTTSDTITAHSSKDLLIATSNLSGEILDTARHTTTVKQSVYNDINLCQDEGYFLTGDLFSTVNFTDTDSITGYTSDEADVLIVKIDTDLDFLWARKGGADNWDHGNSAVSDNAGNIYVTGRVEGDGVYFDKNGTELSEVIDAQNSDLFVAKYNKQGDLQWVQTNGNVGNDDGYGLVQHENLVQFCGNIAGEVIFNNDTLESSGIGDLNTGFAIYDIDGEVIGAQGIGGLLEDKGQTITFDDNRNTIISGYFYSNSIDIGDSVYTNSNGANGFIASYNYPFKATFTEIAEVTCNGDNDGRLLATTYFGVGPYVYDWSASTGTGVFNDSVAGNLTAGFYSLTITDSRSEEITITYTITEPAPFIITTDSTNISCFQANDGTLSAGATGNTAPYVYNWTGQNSIPKDDSIQTDLEPGKYMLLVTDTNGCTITDSVTLTQPDKIIFAGTSVVNEDPAGSFTGSIDLNVSGGKSLFTYSWEDASGIMPGRVNDTLNNIQEGYYTAHVVDDITCNADTTILVPGETFRVLLLEKTGISCYGLNDGSAVARIGSGDKGNPYTYTFTDSIGAILTAIDDTIISNLAIGWYYVTAQEVGGDNRTSVDSLLINQPDSLIISLDPDSVSCYGNNTGSIALERIGGTTPISYNWSNGASTQSISSLNSGRYNVTVIDNNGCTVLDSADVEQNDSIEIVISVLDSISCNGYNNGILQAVVTGGKGSYSYLWNDPGNQTSYRATGLGSGIYSVTVQDALLCSNTNSHTIGEPEALSIFSVDSADITCQGFGNGRIAVTMSGGSAPYSYAWTYGLADTNVVENLPAATYNLTVTDDNNCVNDSLSVLIEQPLIALTLSEDAGAHSDNDCFGDTDGSLTVIASGGWSSGYEYSIEANNWQGSPTFSNLSAQEYTISVRDENNCVQSANIDILEAPEIEIISANVFGNTLSISATGGTQGLSYFLNGGGTPQATGTFPDLTNGTYYIEITDNNNCGPIRSGDLTIDGNSISETLNEVVNLYPNPSNGLFKLEIEIPGDGEFNLEIYSITGVKVHSEVIFGQAHEFKQVNIDLSENSKGIYLVNINGVTLNTKLIIE